MNLQKQVKFLWLFFFSAENLRHSVLVLQGSVRSRTPNRWGRFWDGLVLGHAASFMVRSRDPGSPRWMVDFYGFHVGKYTSPMDPMGLGNLRILAHRKTENGWTWNLNTNSFWRWFYTPTAHHILEYDDWFLGKVKFGEHWFDSIQFFWGETTLWYLVNAPNGFVTTAVWVRVLFYWIWWFNIGRCFFCEWLVHQCSICSMLIKASQKRNLRRCLTFWMDRRSPHSYIVGIYRYHTFPYTIHVRYIHLHLP